MKAAEKSRDGRPRMHGLAVEKNRGKERLDL